MNFMPISEISEPKKQHIPAKKADKSIEDFIVITALKSISFIDF